jgi:hypothetical protein
LIIRVFFADYSVPFYTQFVAKTVFLIFFFILINTAHADEDLCKYFQYCGGSSRAYSPSVPSNSSAASLNPSNISSVKGFGIEAIYQPNNPPSFDIVTGNGKIGALVSPTLENGFFGNRSIELDNKTFARKMDKIQYKNKKLNLSIGGKLIAARNIGLDLGISVKRNPDIKKINLGYGLNARFFLLTFGAYIYQDDVSVDLGTSVDPYTNTAYSTTYGATTYKEKFLVTTYTVGAKIKNLSLDYGVIKTRYKFYPEPTQITLFSSSLTYNKFLFNFALRKEDSSNLVFMNGTMLIQRSKGDVYYGVDYLVNKTICLGLQYNYYLLNEWSAKLTLFF